MATELREPSNKERAYRARKALKVYIAERGDGTGVLTSQENITDLITDALHLADILRRDPEHIISRAKFHFEEERNKRI